MHRIAMPYLAAASALGILALLNVVWLRHYVVSTAIAIVIYVMVLVLAYFGGRAAHQRQSRPGWFGAAIGGLFGVIAGFGSFLIRDTIRDIDVPAREIVRLRLLAWANSPTGHVAAILTAMITFGIVSLIVGSLGGSSIKEQDHPGSANP